LPATSPASRDGSPPRRASAATGRWSTGSARDRDRARGVERARGEQEGARFADGARDLARADLRWRLAWLEPVFRVQSDARRTPSDSIETGARLRETGVELGTGSKVPWRMSVGAALRRDATWTSGAFVDQSETRVLTAGLETPSERRAGAVLRYEARGISPLADPHRTRSDLGSVRLRGEDRARGLNGLLNVEVTSEGESRRVRDVRFVGIGQGGYDALGNFVGTGDYALAIGVSPDLDRIARAATSLQLGWQFGHADAWRGSRVAFDFETETRRRGELMPQDPFV
jgi:hypothetical protein